MEINQLVYLVAIAEEASFSRAAERLGVAQPSISQQVKKLEDELGTPLLDRLPRRVVPTAAGEKLLEHARRILAELSDARRRLSDSATTVSGSLKIGAIPTIAPYLLPDVLKHFASKHPHVHVDVVEDVTARLASLAEQGELDLAILSTLEGGPTLHVETIGHEALHLLLPKAHRLAKRKSVPWSDLTEERFLVLHEMHCLSGQVAHVCQRRKVRPNVVMRGAQLSTIAEMVSAGIGVSVVPAMMADHDKNPGRLTLPFAGEAPTREICLAWSLLRYRTQAARAMEQTIRQRL
ncbi:LysR family transcriptional regulator [Humisphaera borealis]|uniref:LysR family transcriptional regulator n=1 Tax=Humisphaera borealis TaxID=2807512 RepID=A0A7M2WTC7_9BACT|nr:LysR substrate-binding domain-containing protein [Humisphaera borealis]QOV88767.1 LysR family transcriptional regulator [Humisphaera borealis]